MAAISQHYRKLAGDLDDGRKRNIMKISVVTISYNQAPFLERCLDAVLSQEGVDVEHIVVDACSTDGSREILERYRDRLSVLIIEKDKGPPDGLNKGFSHATGDIFYFLNSDDVVLPGAFEQAAELFANMAEVDVVYGDGYHIDSDDRRLLKCNSSKRFSAYRYLVGAAVVVQQATFFRSDIFHRIGGFNLNNKTCWDGELLLDMVKMGAKFHYVHRDWGLFRLHDTSISGSGRLNELHILDHKRMARKVYQRDLGLVDKYAGYAMRVQNKLEAMIR